MPVTDAKPAPYAPPKTILSILDRNRTKGLPPVVDLDTLTRGGVPATLAPRTLQALQTLDLITEEGKVTDVMEGLRLAPEAEYMQRMGDWLRGAYADALAFVDPETATESQIRDAFRTYKPIGQQDRMVILFRGLFSAAGIGQDRQRQAKRPTLSNGQAVKPRPKPRSVPTSSPTATPAARHHTPMVGGLPAALSGLLATLPPEGQGWTQMQRDKFMTAFPVILDYSYPIVAPEIDPFVDLFDDEETATDQ